METIRLAVAVMHCKNCAANVTRHYEAVSGVSSVEVDLDGQQEKGREEDKCLHGWESPGGLVSRSPMCGV